MKNGWIEAARSHVAAVTRDWPTDLPLAERRKRLRGSGGVFHGGTYWGRKKYGVAVREYLERHGQAPRKPREVESAPNFGPDIIFPFRAPAA